MWLRYCICKADRQFILTKMPPPMSPPMSQTCREIWSFSSCFPSGKKSSKLAIMQMKAEGSRMRPSRRAHFPVQHMFRAPVLRRLWSPVRRKRSGPERLAVSQRYGRDTWTLGKRRRCLEGEAHLCRHAYIKHDRWPEQRSITNLLSNLCFFPEVGQW